VTAQGSAALCAVRHYMAGPLRRGRARLGSAWQARSGMMWQDTVWLGRPGSARYGAVRCGLVWQGRRGAMWPGEVGADGRHGRRGVVRCGRVRQGRARRITLIEGELK
jgi:hypothetical protein